MSVSPSLLPCMIPTGKGVGERRGVIDRFSDTVVRTLFKTYTASRFSFNFKCQCRNRRKLRGFPPVSMQQHRTFLSCRFTHFSLLIGMKLTKNIALSLKFIRV